MPAATADIATDAKRVRFTIEEFERMVEVGIIPEDARVELIDGVMYEMAPIGNWHNATADALNELFKSSPGARVIVRVGGSIKLPDVSEPQPDLAVLRFRADYYRDGGVGPTDVLLVIEVSDSSLVYDRTLKLPMYATAGIPEVWIVTREPAAIEAYRVPRANGYRERLVYLPGESLSPLARPELTIHVSDVTG